MASQTGCIAVAYWWPETAEEIEDILWQKHRAEYG